MATFYLNTLDGNKVTIEFNGDFDELVGTLTHQGYIQTEVSPPAGRADQRKSRMVVFKRAIISVTEG
jgi:hypothetical protein